MAPAGSKKNVSKPATVARKSTKGPLDNDEDDDPLTSSRASNQNSHPQSITLPLLNSQELPEQDPLSISESPKLASPPTNKESRLANKDLSFLLEVGIYHPLGQIDVPPPFRRPFPPPPQAGTSVEDIFAELEKLLAQCHFLGAAHLSGLALTSGNISPTECNTIFRLLAIRYSSLELCDNTLLAAQEAKALEDLASGFYYEEDTLPENTETLSPDQRPLPQHIMPFDLRLQAVRLQSIGFSDPRRGVSSLYDLGLECREHLASPMTAQKDLVEWEIRLQEVGIRVVNALIETGDLDCASRTLSSMRTARNRNSSALTARQILLFLKMGDLEKAKSLLRENHLDDAQKLLLSSLYEVATGDFNAAVRTLTAEPLQDQDPAIQTIAKQNLAVSYLYTGQISKCKTILEQLVDAGQNFQALTINLATVYELSSDKARNQKMLLAEKIAMQSSANEQRLFTNADFKL